MYVGRYVCIYVSIYAFIARMFVGSNVGYIV